jgi:ankyrin repeat protein
MLCHAKAPHLIDARDRSRRQPLHHAAASAADSEVVTLLLREGADP